MLKNEASKNNNTMKGQIKIINKYNDDLNVSGIYILWFPGGYFYIGRSKNVLRRMKQHEKLSNFSMKGRVEQEFETTEVFIQLLIICNGNLLDKLECGLILYNSFNGKVLNFIPAHYRESIKPFRYYYVKSYKHDFRY